jgi:transcriptional regulator with XRE-family HTH domain
MMDLIERVRSERRRQGISLRTLSKQIGIAFSTLARAERGDGGYAPETARCLRKWLGEDTSSELSAAEITKVEELGRAIARSASVEILRIIRESMTDGMATDK